MATTAQINIDSTTLMGDFPIAWTATGSLYKAGTTTDISETTGLGRRKLAATTKVDLITWANETATADKSAKLYVKNTSTSETQYVQVYINSVELGRLYGGDWMWMPYSGGTNEDLEVAPSTDDAVVLEYMLFFE